MDQASGDVKYRETEQPENKQYDGNCPDHDRDLYYKGMIVTNPLGAI
jgi:hypothetical protein